MREHSLQAPPRSYRAWRTRPASARDAGDAEILHRLLGLRTAGPGGPLGAGDRTPRADAVRSPEKLFWEGLAVCRKSLVYPFLGSVLWINVRRPESGLGQVGAKSTTILAAVETALVERENQAVRPSGALG